MPRRGDIHKILLIGSGPIVIGQAAEFDYSGAQACKVLMEEGYEVVLVNSNPATIMTDPEFATATYIEPLLPGPVAQVIAREKPDALLPTLGGQTALNLAKALHEDGTLERHGVELIGADYDAIHRAEDRELLPRDDDRRPACACRARDRPRRSRRPAERSPSIGLPVIVRPAFTLGGRGGGVVRTEAELDGRRRGLAASPISQVLLEESVLGWGEFELEVMRDRSDNVVIVCSIENLDPMGVHTGDTVCVAPQQTLTDTPVPGAARPGDRGDPGGRRRDRRLERPVRGQPEDRRDRRHRDEPARVALVARSRRRPRASRSPRSPRGSPSATRSRRSRNDITPRTPASFEPTIDYVRGEVAALRVREVPGRRGRPDHAHEVGRRGDGDRPHLPAGVRQGDALARARRRRRGSPEDAGAAAGARAAGAGPLRPRARGAAPRGRRCEELEARTHIDPWFLRELAELAADPRAPFAGQRTFKSVDTCAAEFAAETPYYYSGWERPSAAGAAPRGRAGRRARAS